MMTAEEIDKARLDLRERLRQLAIAWGEEVHPAGMPENISSGLMAEECMHLSAYMVVRGLNWNLETFLEKTGEVFDIHRTLLRKEKQRKSELN
jgi:hypothetical protein